MGFAHDHHTPPLLGFSIFDKRNLQGKLAARIDLAVREYYAWLLKDLERPPNFRSFLYGEHKVLKQHEQYHFYQMISNTKKGERARKQERTHFNLCKLHAAGFYLQSCHSRAINNNTHMHDRLPPRNVILTLDTHQYTFEGTTKFYSEGLTWTNRFLASLLSQPFPGAG